MSRAKVREAEAALDTLMEEDPDLVHDEIEVWVFFFHFFGLMTNYVLIMTSINSFDYRHLFCQSTHLLINM